MTTISVNQFRDKLRYYVDFAAKNHEPVTVTRRSGDDFIVLSLEDWHSIEETLHVLQNQALMMQIEESAETNKRRKGRPLSQEELDEIDRI